MQLRVLAALSLAAAAVPVHAALPGGGSAKNVLIVVADDLNQESLASYGVKPNQPATPTIDGLAASGVRFQNAWASPVCSPARAAIQTGRYGFRTGIGTGVLATNGITGLPRSEVTLPEMLDLGTGGAYSHAAFGKWHLDAGPSPELSPNLAGYDHYSGALSNFLGSKNYYNWDKVVDGQVLPTTRYATTETVDDAVAWLATAHEPWFCYVAFNAPHVPYHAPPPELHQVDLSGATPQSAPELYYRAMVEAMDTELGRLLNNLPGDSADRTTIVFLSDNGAPEEVTGGVTQTNHGKGSLFEGGVKVPLIVSAPDLVTAGASSQALVGAVDVFATLADLAGVDTSTTLPGRQLDSLSLMPHVFNPALPSARPFRFSELIYPNGAPFLQPFPPIAAVPTTVQPCESNLGFASGGSLQVCSRKFHGWNQARLQAAGAPPFAPGWLVASVIVQPEVLLGGTLIPSPLVILPYQANAFGTYIHTANYGLEFPLPVYYQGLFLDAGLPSGVGFTHAIEVAPLRTHVMTVADGRYKWMIDALSGQKALYDLQLDPGELNDLLRAGNLTPAQDTAYQALVGGLGALLGL